MRIEFNWDSGWMAYDTDFLIHCMTLKNYTRWAKLFARYGTPEQHNAFLELLQAYITAGGAKEAVTKIWRRKYEILEGRLS